MVGQLQPVEGTVSRRSGLSIGRYHQHSAEVLDLSKSPVDYLKVSPYVRPHPVTDHDLDRLIYICISFLRLM